MWEYLRGAEPPTRPVCGHCGHDLAGLAAGDSPILCPECGRRAVPAQGRGHLSGRRRALAALLVVAPWIPVWAAGLLWGERLAGRFTVLALLAAVAGSVLGPVVVWRRLPRAERRWAIGQLITDAVAANAFLIPAALVWAEVLRGIGC